MIRANRFARIALRIARATKCRKIARKSQTEQIAEKSPNNLFGLRKRNRSVSAFSTRRSACWRHISSPSLGSSEASFHDRKDSKWKISHTKATSKKSRNRSRTGVSEKCLHELLPSGSRGRSAEIETGVCAPQKQLSTQLDLSRPLRGNPPPMSREHLAEIVSQTVLHGVPPTGLQLLR